MLDSIRSGRGRHRFDSLLPLLFVTAILGCSQRAAPLAPNSSGLHTSEAVDGPARAPSALSFTYQVRTFDVPATFGDFTSAFGINDFGTITGNYAAPDGSVHGFIYQLGRFTDVVVPGAGPADLGSLGGINDLGTAVGGYSDADDVQHMYLRNRRGGITKLPDPVADAFSTDATGINIRGTLAGTIFDANGQHGFLYKMGVATLYDHPGTNRTRLLGVNARGQAVGFWFDTQNIRHGFLLGEDGSVVEIDVPGSTGTGASGINDRGQIVGFYRDQDLITHGFLLDRGTFTTIDFAGSADTRLLAINNWGVIVGTYDFFSHGLVAFPVISGLNGVATSAPAISSIVNSLPSGKVRAASSLPGPAHGGRDLLARRMARFE